MAKFDRGVISFALSLTLVLFRPAFAQAEETALTGLVVSIIDGDTIDLLVNRRQIRVRLADIDTPERGQPWYQKAKLALGRKVFGETVTALSSSQDRYGREIAQLMFDDRHINSEMVAEGMAWVYRKYSSNPLLLALEEKARLERLGLWSVDHQIPPWDWRRKPRSPVSGSPRVDVCGLKRLCRQMSSCEEAMWHYSSCGVLSLDGDEDGVPCEAICSDSRTD